MVKRITRHTVELLAPVGNGECLEGRTYIPSKAEWNKLKQPL
ncbi:hypothetical protein P6P90_09015 [Ectobacillus antri]|jgi:hypothetical protein|uniref:Uncharacterized protein n=1 Tax=Ectobacillus antri TaxID=2486280 RepID=A0ABT6H5Q2_9BACI|nr:hypothetical protein [Ectobacillus antri]MDG4657011.1 hypothetical protein [Ectobacillus antri]MDG5754113.1 hypothetical protein [Ectobacillus antri]